MYCVYDFGSAWDIYLADHLTGWFYWAIAGFTWSLAQAIYLIVINIWIIVEMFLSEDEFKVENSILSDAVWFWVFMAANLFSIIIPMSKLIVIFVELEHEEDEDRIFYLKSKQGQFNY